MPVSTRVSHNNGTAGAAISAQTLRQLSWSRLTGGLLAQPEASVTVVDNEPPALNSTTPTMGSVVMKGDAIDIDLSDNIETRAVVLIARFPSLNAWEVIYDGSAFSPAYVGTINRPIPKQVIFTGIKRKAGWPANFEVKVVAVDKSGNES